MCGGWGGGSRSREVRGRGVTRRRGGCRRQSWGTADSSECESGHEAHRCVGPVSAGAAGCWGGEGGERSSPSGEPVAMAVVHCAGHSLLGTLRLQRVGADWGKQGGRMKKPGLGSWGSTRRVFPEGWGCWERRAPEPATPTWGTSMLWVAQASLSPTCASAGP